MGNTAREVLSVRNVVALALTVAAAIGGCIGEGPAPGNGVAPELDASSGDSSSRVDAPVEAEDASGTWCSSGGDATFCADFDVGALDRGFASKQTSDGGLLVLDPNVYRSEPHSLRASIPKASGAPYGTNAVLAAIVPILGKTQVKIEFDVNLSNAPKLEANEALQFFAWGVDGNDMMALARKAAGWVFFSRSYDVDAGAGLEQALVDPPSGWTHVVVTATLAEFPNGSVRLDLGEQHLERSGIGTLPKDPTTTRCIVGVASGYSGIAPAASANYDNLIVTTK